MPHSIKLYRYFFIDFRRIFGGGFDGARCGRSCRRSGGVSVGRFGVVDLLTVVYYAISAASAQKIGFFRAFSAVAVCLVGSWAFVRFWGVFVACFGCPSVYPIGINTPPLCVGVREKGRVTHPLPEQKFLKRVKKG